MTETWQQRRDRKRREAAARLEDLAAIATRMVRDLRGEPGDQQSQDYADLTAHARVYWLRKQLGYVVADLGYNAPATWATKAVEREYQAD